MKREDVEKLLATLKSLDAIAANARPCDCDGQCIHDAGYEAKLEFCGIAEVNAPTLARQLLAVMEENERLREALDPTRRAIKAALQVIQSKREYQALQGALVLMAEAESGIDERAALQGEKP